jgi:hypothetical protein
MALQALVTLTLAGGVYVEVYVEALEALEGDDFAAHSLRSVR